VPRYRLRGRVRPEHVAEYTRVHREVRPEMLEAPAGATTSCSCPRTGRSSATSRPADLEAVQRAVQAHPVNDRWQRSVAALFAGQGAPDQAWEVLPEVFHLDGDTAGHDRA